MPKSTAAGSAGHRILLVADNKNGLVARRSVLMAEGYEVKACSSPHQAMEEFTAGDPYAVVITDYRFAAGGMNGVDLMKALREHSPAVRVLLISSVVELLGLNERNTGADSVVSKGAMEVSHMLREVERLLHIRARRKPAQKQAAKRPSARRA